MGSIGGALDNIYPTVKTDEDVPLAALIFLGVIFVFLLGLVLLFMYLNKMACFRTCGGCPCLEEKKASRKKAKDKDKLVESYGYDDDDESSSDSDNEVLLRYQQSISAPGNRKPSVSGYKKKPLAALKGSNGLKPNNGRREWLGEAVDSVFGDEDENKNKISPDSNVPASTSKEAKNLLNRTKDQPKTQEPEDQGLAALFTWNQLLKMLPGDLGKTETKPAEKDVPDKTDYCKIRVEYDEYQESTTEASDSGAYMSEGTRTDELSLAEQGAPGTGSDSLGSSERGGYDGDDIQQIVGEPVDEGLIAGVGDDILYPEEALHLPGQKEPTAICGELDVAFQYSGESRRMNVTVVQAYNLPTKEQGGSSSYRIRLLLHPTKRQRAKTRIRESNNPEFKELFRFTRLYPHELVSLTLRLRLYGTERLRRERLVGEGQVKFSSLNTATQQIVRVKLESRNESSAGGNASPYSSSSDLSHSESNSSLPGAGGSHGSIPELLVGLGYNATTGRLGVEIIKGSHFKLLSGGRAPDSYVKVSMMSSSGFEMTKSKTSVRRAQSNPTYKETFIFQVAQFQLSDVTLLFTVFNKKGMKRKDTIGWFSMGLSNSSEEELAHWNEMRESRGQQVSRWHALLES